MTTAVIGAIMFGTSLIGVPIAIGIWFGLGPGLFVAFLEMGVIGFVVGYDAYIEAKGKPDA